MARDAAITAENETPQECAAQDGHEVTDIEGHDSQHAKTKVSFSVTCMYAKRNSQEISNADNNCIQSRSGRINAESPRSNRMVVLFHHQDLLLDAVL